MIMMKLEWISARVRNYCETLCIAKVLQLFEDGKNKESLYSIE